MSGSSVVKTGTDLFVILVRVCGGEVGRPISFLAWEYALRQGIVGVPLVLLDISLLRVDHELAEAGVERFEAPRDWALVRYFKVDIIEAQFGQCSASEKERRALESR